MTIEAANGILGGVGKPKRDPEATKPAEPGADRYKHLSVRIRADVYKRAKSAAIMTDTRFARFVERALLQALDRLAAEPAP